MLRPNGAGDYQTCMEFRQLGKSGLQVPVLCFGTGTFGGGSEFFRAWGDTDVAEATHLIDICLEAGVNFFDTADVYSQGLSEELLGQAIQARAQREGTHFHQSHVSLRGRSQRRWFIKGSPDSSDRRKFETAEDRLYRRVSYARLRRVYSG
jgi:aryl-alcohol dehydrogenase-like predicted oxidoreductase